MNFDFWNSRYAAIQFAYGTEPNRFYAEQLKNFKSGNILFPAEGEGRNAVYAAEKGFHVVAFDGSNEARKKALQLASDRNVMIDYRVSSFDDIEFAKNEFDLIVLIFVHFPPNKREGYHRKLIRFLKPGGSLILEGFSKEQIHFNSGGPKDLTMLFSEDELQSDFRDMKNIWVSSEKVILNEGLFHNGEASVIRFIGKK